MKPDKQSLSVKGLTSQPPSCILKESTTDHPMAYLNWSIPVSSLINKLQKAGFSILSVYDGEEYIKPQQNKSKLAIRKEAVESIVSVDESWVKVQKGDQKGTLFIVLGNDPYDLVCDYSDWNDLEKVVTEHSNLWEGKNCPVVA